MIRKLALTCLWVVAALGGVGEGAAWAKPRIEILGLEVINPGGGQLDPQVNVVAKELTDAFRARAPKGGAGKYELAPNSEKELVDEKLINTCDTELPACMVPIGQSVGAAMMIYGRIHKEQANYVVDLVLLNVTTKAHERNLKNQILPVADAADSVKLTAWAKKTYAKLVDESSLGTILVEITNDGVEGGDVRVDNDPKGTISSGRLPIPNLSDGKHRLVIEVGGFQRFEKDVTVVPNERTEVSVTLTRDPSQPDWKIHSTTGTTSETNHANYWRGMFVGGSIVAAAGLSFWIYSYWQETKEAGDIKTPAMVNGVAQNPFSDSICGNKGVTFTGPGDLGHFNKACDFKTYTGYGIAGFSVGAVVMVATFYSAFLKDNADEAPKKTAGRRKTKPTFAVTPVVSPDGGGATLRIDW